jgi:glycosyltransferase involved in cell wall biosynthesis
MALRTPVVATSKGAEGLDAVPGKHLLVADTPEAFASAVIRLLEDPGLRAAIVEDAYALVSARYDWSATFPTLLGLVRQVGTRQMGKAR